MLPQRLRCFSAFTRRAVHRYAGHKGISTELALLVKNLLLQHKAGASHFVRAAGDGELISLFAFFFIINGDVHGDGLNSHRAKGFIG